MDGPRIPTWKLEMGSRSTERGITLDGLSLKKAIRSSAWRMSEVEKT